MSSVIEKLFLFNFLTIRYAQYAFERSDVLVVDKKDDEDGEKVAEGGDNQIAKYDVHVPRSKGFIAHIDHNPHGPEAVGEDETAHDQVDLYLFFLEYDHSVQDA